MPLTPYLAGEEVRRRVGIRVQVVEDPASAAWTTGIVWDPDRRLAVGRAGFHGPPDSTASRDLVPSEGLAEASEQIDDEDGLETVRELAVDRAAGAPA